MNRALLNTNHISMTMRDLSVCIHTKGHKMDETEVHLNIEIDVNTEDTKTVSILEKFDEGKREDSFLAAFNRLADLSLILDLFNDESFELDRFICLNLREEQENE